jgi:hypothetical protein
MIDLLSFLTTPEGRTDANCWVVDIFLGNEEHWERDWLDLPEPEQLLSIAAMAESEIIQVAKQKVCEEFLSQHEIQLVEGEDCWVVELTHFQ